MPALDRVLARLDADLDASLERLFAWLRIPSISTDPGLRAGLPPAAEWLRGELASLGFDAALRDTPGHPVVVGQPAARGRPRTCCSTAITTCSRSIRSSSGTRRPSSRRVDDDPHGRRCIVARGACDDKGQVMTFVEALRAWHAETGELPVGVTVLVEGEEEIGSPSLPAFLAATPARS